MDLGAQTVAVTGASGHIGANLVRALVALGRKVRALVHRRSEGIAGLGVEVVAADVLEPASLTRAFAGVGTVFHLAAKISAGWERARVVWEVGVTGTANVVEACLAAQVPRLVHMSSIQALRPAADGAEIDESIGLVEAGDRARGVYDQAKAEAERIVLAAAGRGLCAVVLNPTAVIGPCDFAPSAIGEFLLALARGRVPALIAGASSDFVDVRDVAGAAIAAERKGRSGERYILTGTRMRLVDFALAWAKAAGRSAPRLAVPMWLARAVAPVAPMWARLRGRRPLFTSESLRFLRCQPLARRIKAERELGFAPRSIEETLRDIRAWMKVQGWL